MAPPTFSGDSFDIDKGYSKVALGQGQPLFDSDFNEAQDIKRYTERALGKAHNHPFFQSIFLSGGPARYQPHALYLLDGRQLIPAAPGVYPTAGIIFASFNAGNLQFIMSDTSRFYANGRYFTVPTGVLLTVPASWLNSIPTVGAGNMKFFLSAIIEDELIDSTVDPSLIKPIGSSNFEPSSRYRTKVTWFVHYGNTTSPAGPNVSPWTLNNSVSNPIKGYDYPANIVYDPSGSVNWKSPFNSNMVDETKFLVSYGVWSLATASTFDPASPFISPNIALPIKATYISTVGTTLSSASLPQATAKGFAELGIPSDLSLSNSVGSVSPTVSTITGPQSLPVTFHHASALGGPTYRLVTVSFRLTSTGTAPVSGRVFVQSNLSPGPNTSIVPYGHYELAASSSSFGRVYGFHATFLISPGVTDLYFQAEVPSANMEITISQVSLQVSELRPVTTPIMTAYDALAGF